MNDRLPHGVGNYAQSIDGAVIDGALVTIKAYNDSKVVFYTGTHIFNCEKFMQGIRDRIPARQFSQRLVTRNGVTCWEWTVTVDSVPQRSVRRRVAFPSLEDEPEETPVAGRMLESSEEGQDTSGNGRGASVAGSVLRRPAGVMDDLLPPPTPPSSLAPTHTCATYIYFFVVAVVVTILIGSVVLVPHLRAAS